VDRFSKSFHRLIHNNILYDIPQRFPLTGKVLVPSLAVRGYTIPLENPNMLPNFHAECDFCLTKKYEILNRDIYFTSRNQSKLRGHAYTLHEQRCFSSNRRNFFSIRIVSMWNSLPAETTDFSGLDKFNNSVSNMFWLKFCKVNF